MLCAGWWISSDSADGTCLYSESKHNETKFDGTTLVIFFQILNLMPLMATLPCFFHQLCTVMGLNSKVGTGRKRHSNESMQSSSESGLPNMWSQTCPPPQVGNLREMQSLGPRPRLMDSETLGTGAQTCVCFFVSFYFLIEVSFK